MFLVNFCCAGSRSGPEANENIKHAIDSNSNDKVEKDLRKLQGVLTEFMHFEKDYGL